MIDITHVIAYWIGLAAGIVAMLIYNNVQKSKAQQNHR